MDLMGSGYGLDRMGLNCNGFLQREEDNKSR